MPWWGYLILGVCSVFWIWILALINKDSDNVLEKKYNERNHKK